MNARQLPLIFAGLLTAVTSTSAALPEPPSPAEAPAVPSLSTGPSITLDKTRWQNVFVGRYGEVFRFSSDYAAEVELRGPMEIVRLHPKTTDPFRLKAPPFTPSADDYVPEKFSALRLMQLIVIPKDVPRGYRSLTALREAKKKELESSGAHFRMSDLGDWPADSFWVRISSPYALLQDYSQSDRNFFILTMADDRADRGLAYVTTATSDSLQAYLAPFRRPPVDASTVVLSKPVLLPWTFLCALMGAAALLLRRSTRRPRLRLTAVAALGFCATVPIAGWATVALGRAMGFGLWFNYATCLMAFAIAMPAVCAGLSLALGGRRPWQTLALTAAADVLPAAFAYIGARDLALGVDITRPGQDYVLLVWFLMALSPLWGLCLGLTHRGPAQEER